MLYMVRVSLRRVAGPALLCLVFAAVASAQTPPSAPAAAQPQPAAGVTPCEKLRPESKLPPADAPPLARCIEMIAHPVNETYAETYFQQIRSRGTVPDQDQWPAYNEASLLADYDRLWRTGFLDNAWIEVIDEPYPNGVMGKHVIFHIEERARVKQVDYVDARGPEKRLKIDSTKIEEKLREENVIIRFDTFVDDTAVRKVSRIIRDMHIEEGYLYAKIDTSQTALPAGPKLVNLTFHIDPGPKVYVREVVFDGNQAFSDRKLRGQLKENKPRGMLGFIGGGGVYYETKMAEDAEAVREFYHNEGYARAMPGQPQVEIMEDAKDGEKRWIRLRIPVDEGPRYRVGEFAVAGNTTLRSEFIRGLFKMEPGEYYSRKRLAKGIEKATEAYGALGFMNWSPDPEFDFSDIDEKTGQQMDTNGNPPTVNITLGMREGEQFHVNRIRFIGNTTTHDSVARRELRVAEGTIFSSNGLKESIRRLNQTGYFKPVENADAIKVEETPNEKGKVDITLTVEEQNRNQLSFGAGVSQFDGFFGQLSFQTANFMGRGETLSVSLQKGTYARNYQVAFTEPYLFERPLTVGTDIYARQFVYPNQYTQDTVGSNFMVGFPIADYTRMNLMYSWAQIKVLDVNPVYLTLAAPGTGNFFLRESLLLDLGGRRVVSKVTPSVVHNTINRPIFPTAGRRLIGSVDFAGLGGNTFYIQTRGEVMQFKEFKPKLSGAVRFEAQYVVPYGSTHTLPVFERIFLGGEYSVRGFDIRTIGPRDETGRAVIGGNKSLLFNAEFYFDPGGPIRLVAFYDAGQVRDVGEGFVWFEEVTQLVLPDPPLLTDPFRFSNLTDPDNPPAEATTQVIGRRNAFKTSTGVELRFFMPVLNVPFRLIAAYNPQRGGVLNNNFQLQPKFTFRFAVGTTF